MEVTKRIEFRRHAIAILTNKSVRLDNDWVQFAKLVGKNQLSGKQFTHLYVGVQACTDETLRIFEKGARDFPNVMPHRFQPYLLVANKQLAKKLWNGPCKLAEEGGRDMLQAAIAEDLFSVTDIALKAAFAFDQWLQALPDGAHALVVGHSPFLEMIVYGYHALSIPQLQPCDGFRIHVDELGIQKLITGKDSPDLIAANARS